MLSKLDETFIHASKLYQNALTDYPTDPNFAYLELVNTGEILTKNELLCAEDLNDDLLLKNFEQIEKMVPGGHIRVKNLKNRLKQIKKKYIKGILRLSDEAISF